jgi:hypothetical protein
MHTWQSLSLLRAETCLTLWTCGAAAEVLLSEGQIFENERTAEEKCSECSEYCACHFGLRYFLLLELFSLLVTLLILFCYFTCTNRKSAQRAHGLVSASSMRLPQASSYLTYFLPVIGWLL